MSKLTISALLLAVTLSACSEGRRPFKQPILSEKDEPQLIPSLVTFDQEADQLWIMSYNVENLFDNEHDIENGKDKEDFSYLPKDYPGKLEECNKIGNPYWKQQCIEADWTKNKLAIKLNQIKRVLTYNKSLPDIMAFNEVENSKVMELLTNSLSSKSSFIITQSPDKRGVDVALVYNPNKLTLESYNEHELKGEYFEKKPTRNILEAHFKFNDEKLTIIVNHWPSQGNPSSTRIIAANTVKDLVLSNMKAGRKVVVLGDFNTVDKDAPHPFRDIFYKTKLDGASALFDAQGLKNKLLSRDERYKEALGTNFYPSQMTWTYLDRIFVSSNLRNGEKLLLDQKSFKVHSPKFITRDFIYNTGFHAGTIIANVPLRYNHNATTVEEAGYSDHFPVSVKLQLIK